MLSLNGVSAWIEVDGKGIEQYGVEVDAEHSRASCWVATQTDKAFAVVFRDNSAYRDHSLCSSLQLDGLPVIGRILLPSPSILNFSYPAPSRTVVQRGQSQSPTTSRPFRFSNLELTDEDELLSQAPAQLGEIRVLIYRAQVLKRYIRQPKSISSGLARVHERSKKAVTHCVSYGQEEETPVRYNCDLMPLDGNIALVTFIFKYRDHGVLQADGLIPRPPPTKKKATTSGTVLDLTVDNDVKPGPADGVIEIVGDATRSRKRRAASTNVLRDVKPVKRIKGENKSVSADEVIDLT